MTPQCGIPIGDSQLSDNQRIAEAIGWQSQPGQNLTLTIDGVPAFNYDPAACSLLKAHMRAQGWHYDFRWGTDGALAYVDTREPHYCIGEAYKQGAEEIALAVAFLAAHDAEQEAKK